MIQQQPLLTGWPAGLRIAKEIDEDDRITLMFEIYGGKKLEAFSQYLQQKQDILAYEF